MDIRSFSLKLEIASASSYYEVWLVLRENLFMCQIVPNIHISVSSGNQAPSDRLQGFQPNQNEALK